MSNAFNLAMRELRENVFSLTLNCVGLLQPVDIISLCSLLVFWETKQ